MPEVSRQTAQDNGVEAFRKQFPIFDQKIYLSSCSQGALSRPVEAAMQEFLESWHAHGNPWEIWVGRMEELRIEFARMINAEPAEVAVTFSVSSALNSLASALSYSDRPKVVTSDFDFPTVGHVWLAQQRRGAEVAFAAADGNRLPLSAFEELVDDKTALVSTTQVCYKNGFKNNIGALAELAHERGAYLLIDAYQAMGTQPMDVKALDLDIMVTGALKYLLGTPGVAFMYMRKELIDRFEPSDSGWFGQENVFAYDVHHLRYASSARRFETGSPPVPNVYASRAALRLLMGVGLDVIQDHVQGLAGRFIEGARRRNLALLTPEEPANRGPLVMVRSTDASKLVETLAREGILCSTRDGSLRVSLHYYNTTADVEAVLGALDRHPDLLVNTPH
jgi:selenocysteine lyase/cysteine desulfurase